MNNNTLVTLIVVVVIVAGAADYAASTLSSSNYSTNLQCVVYAQAVFAVRVTNSATTSIATTTVTTSTNYTTVAATSGTVGQTATETSVPPGVGPLIQLPPGFSGGTVVSESSSQSCVYVK